MTLPKELREKAEAVSLKGYGYKEVRDLRFMAGVEWLYGEMLRCAEGKAVPNDWWRVSLSLMSDILLMSQKEIAALEAKLKAAEELYEANHG